MGPFHFLFMRLPCWPAEWRCSNCSPLRSPNQLPVAISRRACSTQLHRCQVWKGTRNIAGTLGGGAKQLWRTLWLAAVKGRCARFGDFWRRNSGTKWLNFRLQHSDSVPLLSLSVYYVGLCTPALITHPPSSSVVYLKTQAATLIMKCAVRQQDVHTSFLKNMVVRASWAWALKPNTFYLPVIYLQLFIGGMLTFYQYKNQKSGHV